MEAVIASVERARACWHSHAPWRGGFGEERWKLTLAAESVLLDVLPSTGEGQ